MVEIIFISAGILLMQFSIAAVVAGLLRVLQAVFRAAQGLLARPNRRDQLKQRLENL